MGPTPKASGLGVGAVMAVVADATLLLRCCYLATFLNFMRWGWASSPNSFFFQASYSV